jgi:hypothetical protein
VGAVLLKENHPIAFVSKPLGPKLRSLSTSEKEYVAILLAIEQWRYYLELGEFVIATDQRSLTYLIEKGFTPHDNKKCSLNCWGWIIR